MDLTPTDEQSALIEELHRVAERQIRPAARGCEEAGAVAEPVRRVLRDIGVTAPVPEEYGGQGELDALTGVMVAEELAWGDPGVAYDAVAGAAAAGAIARAATAGQRAELLPPLAAGAATATLAFTEREAGTDPFHLEARAEPLGPPEGGVAISGTKYGVAAGATLVLVVTGGPGGPALWRLPPAAGQATPEGKLGLRSAATVKLAVDRVAVAARDRLGGPEPAAAAAALLAARLLRAGIAVGLARAAVEYAAGYARERSAFGRPIGAFQGVSFPIADRALEVDAARLLSWQAAAALDAGAPAGAAARLVAAAWGQAAATAVSASDDAVQVLGGHGYLRDHPVELWYRDAMTLAALDGPGLVADRFLAGAYGPGPA
jgi:acyl-CoA dehydrogenase